MPFTLYFILGFLGSFLGTLPLGPINLSVVNTTLRDSFRSAMLLALAASIVELIYSFISLHCNMWLTDKIMSTPNLPFYIGGLFVLLGIVMFFRKVKPQVPQEEKKNPNSFLKGLAIAAFNPQAIPFWIFVISFYQMNHWIELEVPEKFRIMLWFVVGAAFGKMASLALFGVVSTRIEKHLQRISGYMNKIIGSVLFVIGVAQFF